MDSEPRDSSSLTLKPIKLAPRDWTAEDDQRLTALVADHVSRPKIAELMGRSLSAVNRHVYKLRLNRTKDAHTAVENNISKLRARLSLAPEPHFTKPLLKDIDTPKRTKHSCTLMQLTNKRCRWPCGDAASPDFFYCGKPIHTKRVYCLEHCQRSYVNFRA